MTMQIDNSSHATVHFIQGEHIQDVQIIVYDRQTFNVLPGKYEGCGIKTLASWPIFVTAVLADDQTASQGGEL